MKQIIGFITIILMTLILVCVQNAIANEWHQTTTMKSSLEDSIELSAPNNKNPILLTDRNGKIFSEEYVEWRDPLPLDSIPMFLQQLFLMSEDQGFFDHRGYDIAAIVRAFAVNAAADDVQQGASTITQQVVRMRFLSTEKTYERKFKELLYAAELEKQSSKEEILESYLNEMYFGNRVYGVGAAATYYFNRPLGELSEAEMAFIAAIPNNPSLYDPLRHFDRTKKRQERLIDVLQKNGVITEEESSNYKATPIELTIKKKAGNFAMYSSFVFNELTELIGEVEGYHAKLKNAASEDEKRSLHEQLRNRVADVSSNGLIIETALSSEKQRHDETALNAILRADGLQAGAVVIDNETREVVSVYGGKEYRKSDFNRAFQAIRQPGSAIKPILVYAPFFESGPYHANTPIDSSPICIGSYCPTNIGGYVYGMTTAMEAFRHSHNTAAVRLLRRVGIENAFHFTKPFNFQHVTESDYTYAAALGGFQHGVTPYELSSSYSSFIDGTFKPARSIRQVKDREGNVLYEWKDTTVDVWSSSTVSTIRDLMKDVVLNGTGRGISYTTSYTGAKTGTTDHYKDLWVAGLNDHYTTAVWIGYDQPTPIKRYSDQKIHIRAFSSLLQD